MSTNTTALDAQQVPSPRQGVDVPEELKAAQITMGRGLVDVTRITHEGKSGVLFRPRENHIPVGEPGELPEGEYWPVNGDVVIWVESEAGAQVVIDHFAPFAHPSDAAPDAVGEDAQIERKRADDLDAKVRRYEKQAREGSDLLEALRPFAGILKGNLHYQRDEMRLEFGPNEYDLRFACTVGDLRRAAAALARAETSQGQGGQDNG